MHSNPNERLYHGGRIGLRNKLRVLTRHRKG
jgi:hypothetical protein